MPDLYPGLLGDSWTEIGLPVRQLHVASARVSGSFRVLRGPGLAARLLAALMRMPPACDSARVSLAITRAEEGERWTRTFDGHPLQSRQWRSGDLLVEALGLVQCWFRLRAAAGALVFEQVRATLGVRGFSIPLPRWLSPRVEGRAVPDADAVLVHVRIHAPLVGLLVGYEGRAVPELSQLPGRTESEAAS